MIFYFTGTGNSLHAAKKLLADGEELISIPDAIRAQCFEYELKEAEAVGFVFPVYFYSVPQIVRDFIAKLSLRAAGYVYAVITCGGGISQAGAVLGKCLAARGLKLSYVKPLLMLDNAMLFYQIPTADEYAQRLEDAEAKLTQIAKEIAERRSGGFGKLTLISDISGYGALLCNKTAKFHADDRCIGCGSCAENCPQDAIRVENGRPQWVKPACVKCSACINRCPVGAIQYGRATQRRNRYIHPELR